MERDARRDEERKELSARAATDPAAYERLKQLWNEQKQSPGA
jgi:DNA primase